MKQFQYTANGGETFPVQTFEEVAMSLNAEDTAYLARLWVGGRLRMTNGSWVRLPDLVDAEMAMAGPRDERLERIATAAMVPGITAAMRSPEMTAELLAAAVKIGTTLPAMVAVDAVAFAKALIAELDKQA